MKTNIISIVLILMLSACTLAKEPATVLADEREVVGIFISSESITDQGRVLDLKDNTQTFALINKYVENGESYVESIISGKFYDSQMEVKVMDEVYVNQFTAKVPVMTQYSGVVINHYKILKTANGDFVIGDALNGLGLNGEGIASVNFDFTKDVEINNLRTSETLAFKFEYVPFYPLTSLTLIELDAMHVKLNEADLMEVSEVNLDVQTQWVLVQEQRKASDGSIITSIQAYAKQNNQVIEHSLIRTPVGEEFATPATLRFIP